MARWRPGQSDPNNALPDEVYTVEIHRDERTGVAYSEVWIKGGKWHRADGPAYITRDPETGLIKTENWLRNGELHREDGPAVLVRDPATGRIIRSSWHIDGQKIRPPRRPRQGVKADPRKPSGSDGPEG